MPSPSTSPLARTPPPTSTASGDIGPRSLGNPFSPVDLHFVCRLGSEDIGNVHLAEIKCCSAEGKRIVIEQSPVSEEKEVIGFKREMILAEEEREG